MTSGRNFVDGAFSASPEAVIATGEVAARLIERNHARPDVLFLFVTKPFIGILEDIAPALDKLLSPTILIGCAAEQIVSPDGWLVDGPAIGCLAVNTGEARAIRFEPDDRPTPQPDTTTVVIADPFSFRVSLLNNDISGGFATAAVGPGGNRLLLGDRIFSDGAVGVEFPTIGQVENVPDPLRFTASDWAKAAGMLVFSDLDADLWRLALEEATGSEAFAENGPILSGFVSGATFPAPLTVFGTKNGGGQGNKAIQR